MRVERWKDCQSSERVRGMQENWSQTVREMSWGRTGIVPPKGCRRARVGLSKRLGRENGVKSCSRNRIRIRMKS